MIKSIFKYVAIGIIAYFTAALIFGGIFLISETLFSYILTGIMIFFSVAAMGMLGWMVHLIIYDI